MKLSELNDNEPTVNVAQAAKHLTLSPNQVRKLARAGRIKGYDYGTGARCLWRFRVSDLTGDGVSLRPSSVSQERQLR